MEGYGREDVVWLEPETIGSRWPGCSAKKGSLCPGDEAQAHQLPRWETLELQTLESVRPPWVCPLVTQFSHSVPHNRPVSIPMLPAALLGSSNLDPPGPPVSAPASPNVLQSSSRANRNFQLENTGNFLTCLHLNINRRC